MFRAARPGRPPMSCERLMTAYHARAAAGTSARRPARPPRLSARAGLAMMATLFLFIRAAVSDVSPAWLVPTSQRMSVAGPVALSRRPVVGLRLRNLRRSATAVPGSDVATKVQILMSDTGGGHRASANALKDALEELTSGKVECDIVDVFSDYGVVWPYTDFPELYKFLAKYDVLWGLSFVVSSTPFGLWLSQALMEFQCKDGFKACLSTRGRRADLVISVHPLLQDLPCKCLAELDGGSRKTPFATVVTDLGGAHPTWFDQKVDTCFVPSSALRRAALERGLRDSQIVQHGLPLRSGFWQGDAGSKDAARELLGIRTGVPTVLVVGGGDGMGGIVSIAESLGRQLRADIARRDELRQMVVVCGSNEQALNELKSKDWGDGLFVTVCGFVSNMDQWMSACDVLVTKAGPGTIAEASIKGLPCALSYRLPGQEEGNVAYVREAGFGDFAPEPGLIAEMVGEWFNDGERLRELSLAATAAGRPNATLDIARDLLSMVP